MQRERQAEEKSVELCPKIPQGIPLKQKCKRGTSAREARSYILISHFLLQSCSFLNRGLSHENAIFKKEFGSEATESQHHPQKLRKKGM